MELETPLPVKLVVCAVCPLSTLTLDQSPGLTSPELSMPLVFHLIVYLSTFNWRC